MTKYKFTKTFTFNGRRYYVRGQTLKEVYQKMERRQTELEESGEVVSGDMLLKDWAIKCIETYKVNQSEITREKYLSRVRCAILDVIGSMRMKDIKPLHVQDCMNRQIGKSRTQVNEVYQALKFIFKYAKHNHLIRTDPTEGLQKPTGYIHHRRALTPNERKYFIQVGVTDRRYYYFLLMLYCGCRPSEAAACKGSDLTVKDGVPLLHIRGTKTDNADRYVPVPVEFWKLIKDTPPYEEIARTSRGPVTDNNRRRLWESYTRNINIAMGCRMYRNALVPPYPLADDLVPYCLRHEYCTELARRGVDIRIAQRLMGHADIKLTANIYTNLQNDDIVSVGATLGATLYGEKRGKMTPSNT